MATRPRRSRWIEPSRARPTRSVAENLTTASRVAHPSGSVELREIPTELLVALAAIAALLAAVQTLRLFWRRFSRSRRLRLQGARAAAGEARAELLLRRLGFAVLGRQVAVSYDVGIDGAPVTIDLRADYLVASAERRYVAEVKTGKLAPRIDTSATRRQLLEYRVAFDVDGVLLVDAETGRVHVVEFPLDGLAGGKRAPGARIAWLVAGLAIGALGVAAMKGPW